jgi:hypothetical protein
VLHAVGGGFIAVSMLPDSPVTLAPRHDIAGSIAIAVIDVSISTLSPGAVSRRTVRMRLTEPTCRLSGFVAITFGFAGGGTTSIWPATCSVVSHNRAFALHHQRLDR